MSKTHEYLDYLEEQIGIAPANSQEELDAAQTISKVMQDHNVDPQLEEFSASTGSQTLVPIFTILMLVGLIMAGIGSFVRIIGAIITIIFAVTLTLHHQGRISFDRVGPQCKSQNVVGLHQHTGPKVIKGNRPIVIVAHYDTPRVNPLIENKTTAAWYVLAKQASTYCIYISMIAALLQLFGFIPSIVRTIIWIVGIVAGLIPTALAIGDIATRFGDCTDGANDNKSSVAALLSIVNNVHPGTDRALETEAEKAKEEAQRAEKGRKAAEAKREAEAKAERLSHYRRHGVDTLRSLNMLPEDCTIEYEREEAAVAAPQQEEGQSDETSVLPAQTDENTQQTTPADKTLRRPTVGSRFNRSNEARKADKREQTQEEEPEEHEPQASAGQPGEEQPTTSFTAPTLDEQNEVAEETPIETEEKTPEEPGEGKISTEKPKGKYRDKKNLWPNVLDAEWESITPEPDTDTTESNTGMDTAPQESDTAEAVQEENQQESSEESTGTGTETNEEQDKEDTTQSEESSKSKFQKFVQKFHHNDASKETEPEPSTEEGETDSPDTTQNSSAEETTGEATDKEGPGKEEQTSVPEEKAKHLQSDDNESHSDEDDNFSQMVESTFDKHFNKRNELSDTTQKAEPDKITGETDEEAKNSSPVDDSGVMAALASLDKEVKLPSEDEDSQSETGQMDENVSQETNDSEATSPADYEETEESTPVVKQDEEQPAQSEEEANTPASPEPSEASDEEEQEASTEGTASDESAPTDGAAEEAPAEKPDEQSAQAEIPCDWEAVSKKVPVNAEYRLIASKDRSKSDSDGAASTELEASDNEESTAQQEIPEVNDTAEDTSEHEEDVSEDRTDENEDTEEVEETAKGDSEIEDELSVSQTDEEGSHEIESDLQNDTEPESDDTPSAKRPIAEADFSEEEEQAGTAGDIESKALSETEEVSDETAGAGDEEPDEGTDGVTAGGAGSEQTSQELDFKSTIPENYTVGREMSTEETASNNLRTGKQDSAVRLEDKQHATDRGFEVSRSGQHSRINEAIQQTRSEVPKTSSDVPAESVDGSFDTERRFHTDTEPVESFDTEQKSKEIDQQKAESMKAKQYTKPEMPDDPNWGKSSFTPQIPDATRQAILNDVPDPAKKSYDPFAERTQTKGIDDLPVSGQPAIPSGSTHRFDVITPQSLEKIARETQEPQDRGRHKGDRDGKDKRSKRGNNGWKGGATPKDEFRDHTVESEDQQESEDKPETRGYELDVQEPVFEEHQPVVQDVQTVPEPQSTAAAPQQQEEAQEAAPKNTVSVTEEELRDAVLSMNDDDLISHDIWFVATGGSELGHGGIKSFLRNHREDISGAFVINLDCIGAGTPTLLTREGSNTSKHSNHRLVRMLSEIAKNLGLSLNRAPYDYGDTDATTAIRTHIRAVTIMGMDENGLPAYSHTLDDVNENVDGDQVADIVALVTELIRES